MDSITETASFSSLAWRPYACLCMRSLAISLKVNEKQVSFMRFVFSRCTYNFFMIDIVSRELLYVRMFTCQ